MDHIYLLEIGTGANSTGAYASLADAVLAADAVKRNLYCVGNIYWTRKGKVWYAQGVPINQNGPMQYATITEMEIGQFNYA